MEIKDLQARQGDIDIVLEIVEKGDVREFEKFGKKGRVCNAVAQDETGKIKLTLWNEQIDQVNVGDKVHLSKCYVGEYQGELQLSTGKFGQLEVVGKAEPKPSNESEKGLEKPEASQKPEPEEKTQEELPEEIQPEEEEIENNH